MVNVDVADGQHDAFIEKSLANASESVKEDDNQCFDLLRSKDDPSKFVLMEIYGCEKGPADHKQTAHYLAWREGVADMMATPRKGVQYSNVFPPDGSFKPYWHSAPSNWPSTGPADISLLHAKVKSGMEVTFAAASRERAALCVQDPGCLRVDVFQERADPSRFVLLEVFVSAEEAAKDKESKRYVAWRESVDPVLEEELVCKGYEGIGSESWRWAAPAALSGKAPPTPALQPPKYTLLDGNEMPVLGFGCYKVGVVPASAAGAAATAKPATPVRQVIADAIAAGYRCFDCAQFYENEAEVGAAIAESGVPRSELYIISKAWTSKIYEGPEAVKAQCQKSLADLKCGYLDLYLTHWPVPGKHVDAYRAIKELKEEGLVKSIGVSNYTIEDLAELQAAELPIPTVNQIEINPFLYRKRTIKHFEDLGVKLQAYRAMCNFGKSASLEHADIQRMASKYKRSAAQVLGRWCVQKGFQHIPKSEKRARMEENAQLFDWSLDEADVEALDAMTTQANLDTFKATYFKCVVRDTPLEGNKECLKPDVTVD